MYLITKVWYVISRQKSYHLVVSSSQHISINVRPGVCQFAMYVYNTFYPLHLRILTEQWLSLGISIPLIGFIISMMHMIKYVKVCVATLHETSSSGFSEERIHSVSHIELPVD